VDHFVRSQDIFLLVIYLTLNFPCGFSKDIHIVPA
jgi:hypothetical protein